MIPPAPEGKIVPKVETEILPDRQAKLKVTVEPELLQQELKSAATRIARKVNIPGFRRGKAPYHIILRYFGEDTVFDEAIEQLGQSMYRDALAESELEPYAPGSLDDISRDPLVLSYTVPLMPVVDLGKYRDIRVKYGQPDLTEADIESAIDRARESQATHEHVDRPVELEDVALLDIKGVFLPETGKKEKKTAIKEVVSINKDDEVFLERTGTKVLIADKATYPVPGFPRNIIGMAAGDSREFDVEVSKKNKDIDEDLRGRSIHFSVTCHEVFKREAPTLDDDFARSLGDYKDLADLRQKVREEMEQDLEANAKATYASKVLDTLLEKVVKVSYPQVVVDKQLDEMVEDFDRQLRQQGLNLDDYLSLNKLTLEAVREDFRKSAVTQIERGLTLGEITEAEQLVVSDTEIEDETQTRLLSFGAQASVAKTLMTSPAMRQTIANRLMTDKALERLAQIGRGEAPDLADSGDQKTAKGKPVGKASAKKPRAAKKAALADKSNELQID